MMGPSVNRYCGAIRNLVKSITGFAFQYLACSQPVNSAIIYYLDSNCWSQEMKNQQRHICSALSKPYSPSPILAPIRLFHPRSLSPL